MIVKCGLERVVIAYVEDRMFSWWKRMLSNQRMHADMCPKLIVFKRETETDCRREASECVEFDRKSLRLEFK